MFKNRRRNQLMMGLVPAMNSISTSGVRNQQGATVPYHDDPIRNPAASFIPNGYMTSGYDTGRKY